MFKRWLIPAAVVVFVCSAWSCDGDDPEVKQDSGKGTQHDKGSVVKDGDPGKQDKGGTKQDKGGGKQDGPQPSQFGKVVGWSKAKYAEDLVVVGKHAYVCGKEQGLYVFDVSSPASPSLIKTIKTTHAWDVSAADNYLFLADYKGGLRIYDITKRANPTPLGVYKPGWKVIQVVANMAAKRAYISGGDGQKGRLVVLGLNKMSAPKVLGEKAIFTSKNNAGTALAYRGNHVFYGQADGRLLVFDASQASALKQVGTYFNKGTPGHSPWALGLFVHGDTLFMADWGAGVILLNISKPASPTEVAVFNKGTYAFYDVFARGKRAYIALDGGLGVLDLTNPKAPTLVGGKYLSLTIKLNDGPHGVWVLGDYAYVADNKEQTLTVVNIKE